MNRHPALLSTGRAQRAHRRRDGGSGRDGGSVTVEVVGLLVPSIAMCVLLLVFAYRLATAGQALTVTSASAARAASLQPDAAAGLAAARSAATTDLTRPGHPQCTDGLAVALDAGQFRPGGLAVVTITCTLSAQEVARLAVPGHLTRAVTSRAPIGQYSAEAQR